MNLRHRQRYLTPQQQLGQLVMMAASVLAVLLLLAICCGCFSGFFVSAAGGVV